MKFEHFLGTDNCDDTNEIETIIKKQDDKNTNEFWISFDDPFPCIGLLTYKDLAYVHFFDEEGSPGFRGISACNLGLDLDKTTIFYSNNGSEIIEVENECVIDIEKAIEVVKEFFITKKIPTCIEWDEI